MQPLGDFLADIAPKRVYGNTVAFFCRATARCSPMRKPYPTYCAMVWKQAHVPTVIEVMHHNIEHGFPFNSPRLAWEMIHEFRRYESCHGIPHLVSS